MPGISAVVRRLHAGRVQTTAGGRETGADVDTPARAVEDAAALRAVDRTAFRAIINWSGVPVDDGLLRARLSDAPVFAAGGASTVAADNELVSRLSGPAVGPAEDVAIVVKAWEPPLLEFSDFVGALRRALGSGPSIVVYPVTTDEAGRPAANPSVRLAVWRRQAGLAGDPWLRVAEMAATEKEEEQDRR
jgi:hypothetical protein